MHGAIACFGCENNRIYWSDSYNGWILECKVGLFNDDKYDCNEYEPRDLDQIMTYRQPKHNQERVKYDQTNS